MVTYRGRLTRAELIRRGILPVPRKRSALPVRDQDQTCAVCSAVFRHRTRRQTCSTECHYFLLTGMIGHTKRSVHMKADGTEVKLGSTWEAALARRLDFLGFEWVRPGPLPWVDAAGKRRLYYPDFFLPELGVYLDPKNPFRLEADREKLAYFEGRVTILVGTPGEIANAVLALFAADLMLTSIQGSGIFHVERGGVDGHASR